MKLELGEIMVDEIEFGVKTEIRGNKLIVKKEELINYLTKDNRIKELKVELAKPGEEVRIMPVKDVIEPRVKVDGPGEVFPGVIGEEEMVGSGRTHALKGVSVVTTGEIVGFQEGIIDMSGPGAKYTPFSQLNNIVLNCEVEDDLDEHEHEKVLRLLGLKAAAWLGKLAQYETPDQIQTFEQKPLPEAITEYPNLPKVGYINMLLSEGLLHDTYVYGVDAKQILPSLISPTEIMDGAIISGNCVSACDKNTTYVHQNNPIIKDLYKYQGKEYNFIGTIVTNEQVTLNDKEKSANYTAKLAQYLGLDAVIISEEGFGNPDADLMMNCNNLEKAGIDTVLVTDEFAGEDGSSQSLADADPEADAVITAGNANEVVALPPMQRVIGSQKPITMIAGGAEDSLAEDGSIKVELQTIMGATNELGFHNLTARRY